MNEMQHPTYFGAIVRKELADQITSKRFFILFLLVAVTALSSLYVASQSIRDAVSEEGGSSFVFLQLFTATNGNLPPFITFVSFLGPLIGLSLGFDAINSERANRTLSRVLAQPVHRDQVINAKFLAAVVTVAVMFFTLGILVMGLGLILIGVPPTFEEVLRILTFLLLTIVYVAFWLNLSILFSILFRQAATSALTSIAIWLFFSVFFTLLAGLAADALAPVDGENDVVGQLRNQQTYQLISRISPTMLYNEVTTTLLIPSVRALGPVLVTQLQGAIPGALPFGQSLLLTWPQWTGLIAATLICFAVSYVLFMRQEIRA